MPIAQAIRFSIGVASSVIVLEHPTQVACPNCGTLLHLVIVGIQNLQMKTSKVPVQQRQLIVPAGSLCAS
jgi:hypothetical protein